MLSHIVTALWGLLGGVGYAGPRLATALWGGREITARARKLAVAQFGVALILAPAASAALTPMLLDSFPKATPSASAFFIGLMFNATWPLLMEPQFLRSLIADLLAGAARRLKPGDNP